LNVHRVGSTVQPHTITLTVEDSNTPAADIETDQIDLTVLFKGDFEPDGDVDFVDYAVFANEWMGGSTDPTLTAGWWKFDESSGLTAADSSGNSNTGALVNMNGSEWVGGKYGNALDFDGTEDYVQIPSDSVIERGDAATYALSASFWFKSALVVPPTSPTTLLGTGDGGWFIGNFGNSADEVVFVAWTLTSSSAGYTEILDNNPVSVFDNGWHHVVAQFDSANAVMTLIIDGISSSTNIHTSAPRIRNLFSAPVLIGENHRETGRYWDGLIDDVRIYDYIAEEVFNIADFDEDGTVDFKDLAEFVEDWLKEGI